MDRKPLVSVIMPVYNTDQYLDDAMRSICWQTFSDFEFIVIDDGSTDRSGKIIASYERMDDRVRVVRQENQGIVTALNKGLELARGKYVARMDSDDISLPDRLETQVEFMESHPEVGVCGSACRLFGDSQGVTTPRTESEEIKSWLLFGPCMAHPTVMMRRDLILQHGLYYNPEFKQAEDYELWIRFSQNCEMANIPEPLLLYRVRDKQATRAFKSEVHRWSGLVHAQALRLLGVEPSEEELNLHLSLHTSEFKKSRDYVERIEKWLCKLLETNQRNKARDQEAFAGTLFEIWRCLFVREVELGAWMWRKFKKSEVFRVGRPASQQSAASLAMLFCCANLSQVLERTTTGRSVKHFARNIKNAKPKLAGNGGNAH